MSEIEFQNWSKIPRLNRDMVVTEKIDGNQAAVGIVYISEIELASYNIDPAIATWWGQPAKLVNDNHLVYAQSRNRIITPKEDNHGFARWVYDYAELLVTTLGEGLHFGEWWGSGINRGYGLQKGEKRFSLFNVKRWSKESFDIDKQCNYIPKELDVVPIIHTGPFSTLAANMCLESLKLTGSLAAPGFMRPEGVVVYHTAANMMFQATVLNDDKPKSAVKSEVA